MKFHPQSYHSDIKYHLTLTIVLRVAVHVIAAYVREEPAVIPHPHLLVRGTNEWFLPTGATFRVGLASESHWLQPVLVHTVHWWPAPVSVGGLLVAD